jgi:hypothetical protein
MSFVMTRLLLLLLVAVDWASDPYHGQCAFSREIGNQVVVLAPTLHRQKANAAPLGTPPGTPALPDAVCVVLPSTLVCTIPPAWHAPPPCSADLLYRLMSLQL